MMACFCVQCGSAIPPGSGFCTACGQPAPSSSPVTAASGPGKLLSGRGAAAIAAAILLGGAAAAFAVVGGDNGGGGPGGATTTTSQYAGSGSSPPSTQPQPLDPREVERPEGVGSGTLTDLVQERPGVFVLAGVDRNAEMISNTGANDGIILKYEFPAGTLTHALLAYGSAGDAESALADYVQTVAAEGGYQAEGATLVKDNQEVGKVVVLRREQETVVWTHGSLMAIAIAAPPYAVEFLDAVTY